MSYKSQIRTLEQSYQQLDNELFQLEKNGKNDPDQVRQLTEKKSQVMNELRRLNRLQWEEDHERVNFDDDR